MRVSNLWLLGGLLLLGVLACALPFQGQPTATPPTHPDLGVTMTALAIQQTSTALQLTRQALATSPTVAPATPAAAGPYDCGTDTACLIQAAQTCHPATGQYALDMEFFGAQVHTVTQFDIHGPNAEGQCAFDVATAEVSVQFTEEAKQQMKANGMTDEQIEAQRQMIEQQQRQSGPSGSCVGRGADLAAMLQRWQEGSFSMDDWAAFTCTGGTLAQAGETIVVTLEVTEAPTEAPATATPAPTTTPPSHGLPGNAVGNLYCRTGPAPYYPAIDSMKAGDTMTVLAQSPESNDYWQVRTPRGNVCWVWGRWLNIQGDGTTLPVGSAPPPPPGAFSIRLLRQDACSGSHYLVFSITNRGPKPIESLYLRVQDLQSGYAYEIPVPLRDSLYRCGGATDPLEPAQEAEVWVPLGAADLVGRVVQVTGKACTEDGLSGQCVERTPFNVTVP